MASAEINIDAKLDALTMTVIETFESLHLFLEERKRNLLSRIEKMKEEYGKNVQLDMAIKQLIETRDNILTTLTSNLVGDALNSVKKTLDNNIDIKKVQRIPIEKFELIEFRCFEEKIRRLITETDLIELIPQYAWRRKPSISSCRSGSETGKLHNPRSIALDRDTNELYVADLSNHRIQVLNTEGGFLRAFGSGQLNEPYGLCLSLEAVFVGDIEERSLLKYDKSGKFVNKIGTKGLSSGCFSTITGMCYKAGLIFVCDRNLQRIQIFDSNLKFVKMFGYGEITYPSDIHIQSKFIYILSRDQNVIYKYNFEGNYLGTIQLTSQLHAMTVALFFTMDKNGNFLVTDHSNGEIKIFSPNGVLNQTLGKGRLSFLAGIELDCSNSILCVCFHKGDYCFNKF